jgi:hypothetical protein
MRLVGEVRNGLNVEISLAAVFDEPTVSGMVAAMLTDNAQRARVEKAAEQMLKVTPLSEEEAVAALPGRGTAARAGVGWLP